MLRSIKILVGLTLRETVERMGSRLAEETYDALFLGYPKGLQPYLRRIVEGEPYQNVVADLIGSGLIGEPISYWIKYNVPILEGLGELRRREKRPQVYCLTDGEDYDRSLGFRDEFLRLGLRARITNRIDLDRWKRMLWGVAEHHVRIMAKVVRRIVTYASHYATSLAVFGYLVVLIKPYLERRGYKVELVYLDPLPFVLSPLGRLIEKMVRQCLGRRRVSDNEMLSDIHSHLEYLDYVLRSHSLDDAHKRWFLERALA